MADALTPGTPLWLALHLGGLAIIVTAFVVLLRARGALPPHDRRRREAERERREGREAPTDG